MVRIRSRRLFRDFCVATLTTFVLLFLPICSCRAADSEETPPALDLAGAGDLKEVSTIARPVPLNPWRTPPGDSAPGGKRTDSPVIEKIRRGGVNWAGVFSDSGLFLALEQGFRLGTQPGTRDALKGPFFDDWFHAVRATSGWGDGDNFLTNYIGHPMQGSVTSYIYVQNHPSGRFHVFGRDAGYWTSRLKAAAWSAVYSTQFELGPFSEASVGNVGYHEDSLSGAVDLVVTPLAGLGWQVGEDILDKYVIMRVERWTSNPVILMLVRGFLNPTRSFANLMRLKVPWSRDTRPGIWRKVDEP